MSLGKDLHKAIRTKDWYIQLDPEYSISTHLVGPNQPRHPREGSRVHQVGETIRQTLWEQTRGTKTRE